MQLPTGLHAGWQTLGMQELPATGHRVGHSSWEKRLLTELTQEPHQKRIKRARKGRIVDTLRELLEVVSPRLENSQHLSESINSPQEQATAALPPIQLELTQENLELHEAFLSNSFTMSDSNKLRNMHRRHYTHILSRQASITSLQQPSYKHTYPPSQTIRVFSSTCTFDVNSPYAHHAIVRNVIESCAVENETGFSVMPYPYDPSHDPLLPCCPSICSDASAVLKG